MSLLFILVDLLCLCNISISIFTVRLFDCLSAYLNDCLADLLTLSDCRTVDYLSV